MSERYAVYYTPARDSALAERGASWLGRDVWSGKACPSSPAGGLSAQRMDELTATPRLYGFHGTLKAPFRLETGVDRAALCSAIEAFASGQKPAVIDRLELRWIGSFLALVGATESPSVSDLAASLIRHVEPMRAPLTDAEMARRRPNSLTTRQRVLLADWGYPFVLDEFRFHMTLTGQVPDNERESTFAAACDAFHPWLGQRFAIDRIALFHQPAGGAPFSAVRDWPLSGHADGEEFNLSTAPSISLEH